MKDKIEMIFNSYNENFYERDDEIRGAFLAILANENILYLGPPGTAKTYLAQNICDSIDDSDFFYYLLTRFTTPEEIFGPLSLKGLENDEFKRKMDGCLPTANIALLDEIFKANSSILNSLLTILNERKFHNGIDVINTPLLTVFGASNELPEEDENLEALYDRFLFRYDVGYIQNEENMKKLLFDSNQSVYQRSKLSISDIENIRKKAKSVTFYQDVIDILMAIRKKLNKISDDEELGVIVSDRRWKKIAGVLKVAAAANGYDKVNKSMLLILQHMLWDVPEQKELIKKIIYDLVASGDVDPSNLESSLKIIEEQIKDESYYRFDKEKLPETVYAKEGVRSSYNSRSYEKQLYTSEEVYDHNKNYPNANYYLNIQKNLPETDNSTRKLFSYSSLVEHLKLKYNFSLEKNLKEEISLDLKNAESSFKEYEKGVTKHFDHLIRDMESNIWLSKDTINEMKQLRHHYLHDLKKIETLLNEVKSIKGPIIEKSRKESNVIRW